MRDKLNTNILIIKDMKRIFTLLTLFAIVLTSMAQTNYVYEWKDGSIVLRTTDDIDSLTFSIPENAIRLEASDAYGITSHSAMASVIYDASFVITSSNSATEQGICFSSNGSVSIKDTKVINGAFSKGTYELTMSKLKSGTIYYYRPYMMIGDACFYGPINAFTTLANDSDNPWVSLGMGKFAENFLDGSGTYYHVEIQQNEVEPNTFRLIEPYKDILGDIAVDKYLEFSILPAGSTFNDMTLDAEYVVFNDYNMGQWNSNYAEDIYALHPYRFGRTPDKWTYNVVLEYQENGLPGEVSLAPLYYLFNEGGGWDKTTSNTISILFPGYVKRDYSSVLEYVGLFTKPDGSMYAVGNLALGADAAEVKAIVMPADADAATVADAVAAGDLEATEVEAGRIEIPFNAEELGGHNFQIIVVVLADGTVKSVATTAFDYNGTGNNPWKSIGIGYYTDDVLVPLFYENGTPVTYEVEILEHSDNLGLYRIMNPYAKSVHPLGDDDYAPEGMYIEVNATDAEGVYIQQQSLGMDWGYGEMQLVTNGARYLASNPFEVVKGAGYLGKVVDGVITFPTFTQSNGSNYQAILFMGDSGYLAGMNGRMEIVLPGANAFARNMAKAKAENTKREAIKKSFIGAKASLKLNRILKLQAEKFDATITK